MKLVNLTEMSRKSRENKQLSYHKQLWISDTIIASHTSKGTIIVPFAPCNVVVNLVL